MGYDLPERLAEDVFDALAWAMGGLPIPRKLWLWWHHRGLCHICGRWIDYGPDCHLEHIVPLARGGGWEDDNLDVAHAVCNARKGTRLLAECPPHVFRGPDA